MSRILFAQIAGKLSFLNLLLMGKIIIGAVVAEGKINENTLMPLL